MSILLTICFLFLVGMGYVLMGRIDKSVEKNQLTKEWDFEDNQYGVFGRSEIALRFIEALENNHIPVNKIKNVLPPGQWDQCTHVYALDEDDVENLLFCIMAEKTRHSMNRAAMCNDPENRVLFQKYDVPLLEVNEIQDLIATIIKQGLKM